MAEDGVKLWGKFGMRGRGALPFAPFSTKWSQCIQDAFEAKVECAWCFLEKCLFNTIITVDGHFMSQIGGEMELC